MLILYEFVDIFRYICEDRGIFYFFVFIVGIFIMYLFLKDICWILKGYGIYKSI